MEKRFQVFISSTYADLKDERRTVIQTVIELDCIPAGMELFPAADEEQLTFIKRVIDDCDYYLLIIGGRYGSISDSGVSYTEQEYDYAVGHGLKVIALLHENPDEIPLGKSEKDPVLRDRLQRFRDKASKGRLVKFWKTAGDIPGLVALSLSSTIKMFPAVGWVRANRAASEELLSEVNDLRKKNSRLESYIADLAPLSTFKDLAGLDEAFTVRGRYHNSYFNGTRGWFCDTTWRKIFSYISPYLVKHPNDDAVKDVLEEALFKESDAGEKGYAAVLDDQIFQTVGVQLRALGLVKIEYSQTVSGGMGLFWSITKPGERLMLELRTVRTKAKATPSSPAKG